MVKALCCQCKRACTGGETQIPHAIQHSQRVKQKKKIILLKKKTEEKENTKYYIGNGHIYAFYIKLLQIAQRNYQECTHKNDLSLHGVNQVL